MISRDSRTLYLLFAVAIVGYLMTAKTPPTQWDYMGWLQAASFVLAWISGKLGTSPLAGEHDKDKVNTNGI